MTLMTLNKVAPNLGKKHEEHPFLPFWNVGELVTAVTVSYNYLRID
jgi:hypothetical protein